MIVQALWDGRQPSIFQVEAEAVRYIRAVGPIAWTVYTYLIHYASRAGRPVKLPQPDAIGEYCGLLEDEVEDAFDHLIRYRLLEVTEESQRGREGAVRMYRIAGLQARADLTHQALDNEYPASFPGEIENARQESQALREMLDALMQVSNQSTREIDDSKRDTIYAAVVSIRADGGDAAQIRQAAHLYRSIVPDLPLTPSRLAAAWELLSPMLGKGAD